jgi:hypothetical protein
VGFTENPEKRKQAHRQFALDGKKTPVCDWIRKLDKLGMDFEMTVLSSYPSKHLAGKGERDYIDRFRAEGHRLLNLAPGGSGGELTGNAYDSMVRKQRENFQDEGYKAEMIEKWQRKSLAVLAELHVKDEWAKKRAQSISDNIDKEQRRSAAKDLMQNQERRDNLKSYWTGVKPRTAVVSSEGVTFDSIAATARHYDISKGRVRYAMATGKKIIFKGGQTVTFSGVLPYTAKV